jgi:hypothetical protein
MVSRKVLSFQEVLAKELEMSKTYKDSRQFKDEFKPKLRNRSKPLTTQERRAAKQAKADMMLDKFMEHGLAG